MRKLLVSRDANTVKASNVPLGDIDEDPEAHAKLPYPLYGTFMDITSNSGSGQFNALQFEVTRRFRHGFAMDAAYTLAHSDSNAPDSGNSTIGVVQYDPYNIELDRGPDPNVVRHRFVFNSTWQLPFGRGRAHGADMPRWADAVVGGWTIATIMQARSGQYLTPFFAYGTEPVSRPIRAVRSTESASSAKPGGPTSTAIPTSGAAASSSSIRRCTRFRRRARSAPRRKAACWARAPGS